MPERRPRTEVFETMEEKNDGPSIVTDGFWSVSEFNKAGRRNGPLSSETRQNANDVRSMGSCLRCFVMKEHVSIQIQSSVSVVIATYSNKI